MTDNTTEIKTYAMIGFFLLCVTVLSDFIGFGKGGFSIGNVFTQFTFYAAYGIGALLCILFFTIAIGKITTEKQYGNSVFFNSPGEFPSLPIKFFKKHLRLIFLCLIIFGFMGLIASNYKQTYLDVGTLQEQFTVSDGILYNWLLVVTAENAGAAALTAGLIFGLRFFSRKYNISRTSYAILAIFLVIFSFVAFGLINHELRYSASDASLYQVFRFWTIQGVLTALTGSFWAAWILHGVNNTFVELANAFRSEFILGIVLGSLIVLIVLYILFFVRKKKTLAQERRQEILR